MLSDSKDDERALIESSVMKVVFRLEVSGIIEAGKVSALSEWAKKNS